MLNIVLNLLHHKTKRIRPQSPPALGSFSVHGKKKGKMELTGERTFTTM